MNESNSKGKESNALLLCYRCHENLRKELPSGRRDAYCAECRRTYDREWARQKRGSTPRPIKPVLNAGEKFCFKCERILPVEHFSRSTGKADGRMSVCKDCDLLRQLRWQSKNRAKLRRMRREASRKWRAEHPGYNRRYSENARRKRLMKRLMKPIAQRLVSTLASSRGFAV